MRHVQSRSTIGPRMIMAMSILPAAAPGEIRPPGFPRTLSSAQAAALIWCFNGRIPLGKGAKMAGVGSELAGRVYLGRIGTNVGTCVNEYPMSALRNFLRKQIKAMDALRKAVAISQCGVRKNARIYGLAEFDEHSVRAARVGIDSIGPGGRIWIVKLHISRPIAIAQSPFAGDVDPQTTKNARTALGASMWGRGACTSDTSALLRGQHVMSP